MSVVCLDVLVSFLRLDRVVFRMSQAGNLFPENLVLLT